MKMSKALKERYQLSLKDKKDLLYLMKKIHKIFVENEIEYFAVFGTLLGAVRHYGFVPWDDDIDIAVMRKDVDKVLALSEDFKKVNITMQVSKDDEEYKECKKKKLTKCCTINLLYKSFICDIFIMFEMKNGILQYASPIWRYAENGGANGYFYKKDTYPLRLVPFEDTHIYIPKHPFGMLRRAYGDKWATHWRIEFIHRHGGKSIDSKLVRMNESDYNFFEKTV